MTLAFCSGVSVTGAAGATGGAPGVAGATGGTVGAAATGGVAGGATGATSGARGCPPRAPPIRAPPSAPIPAAWPTPVDKSRVGSISCRPTLEANLPPPSSAISDAVSPSAPRIRPWPGSFAMRRSIALAPGSFCAAREIPPPSIAAIRALSSAICLRSGSGISGYLSAKSFSASS